MNRILTARSAGRPQPFSDLPKLLAEIAGLWRRSQLFVWWLHTRSGARYYGPWRTLFRALMGDSEVTEYQFLNLPLEILSTQGSHRSWFPLQIPVPSDDLRGQYGSRENATCNTSHGAPKEQSWVPPRRSSQIILPTVGTANPDSLDRGWIYQIDSVDSCICWLLARALLWNHFTWRSRLW